MLANKVVWKMHVPHVVMLKIDVFFIYSTVSTFYETFVHKVHRLWDTLFMKPVFGLTYSISLWNKYQLDNVSELNSI